LPPVFLNLQAPTNTMHLIFDWATPRPICEAQARAPPGNLQIFLKQLWSQQKERLRNWRRKQKMMEASRLPPQSGCLMGRNASRCVSTSIIGIHRLCWSFFYWTRWRRFAWQRSILWKHPWKWHLTHCWCVHKRNLKGGIPKQHNLAGGYLLMPTWVNAQSLILLNRSNISLHAHESNTKSSSLQHLDRRGSVGDLYNEFKNGRLMGATALNSRTIEVRFVCNRDEIVRGISALQISA